WPSQSAQDRTVRPGRDGISYLIEAKRHGIVTPLSPNYDDAHKRGALSEDSILLAPWARGWRTSCRAAFKWHREPFFNQDRPNVTAVGFQCSATHFRRVDFGYGAFADGRIGKVEQPALLGECHVSAPLPLELHQQFFRQQPGTYFPSPPSAYRAGVASRDRYCRRAVAWLRRVCHARAST